MSPTSVSGSSHHKKKTKVFLIDSQSSGKSTLISALVHKLVDTQENCRIVRNWYASCVERDPGTAVQFDLEPPLPPNPSTDPKLTTTPTPTYTIASTTTRLDFLEAQTNSREFKFKHIAIFAPVLCDLILLCFPLDILDETSVSFTIEEVVGDMLTYPLCGRHVPKQVPILLVGCKLDLAWRHIMPQGEHIASPDDDDDDTFAADAEQNQKRAERLFEAREVAERVVRENKLDGYVECSGVSGEGVQGVMGAILGIVYPNREAGEEGAYYRSRRDRDDDNASEDGRVRKRGSSCCTVL